MVRRYRGGLGAVAALVAIVAGRAAPAGQSGFQDRQAVAGTAQVGRSPQLEIVPVRDNVYVLGGAGSNIVLSVGRDGVFVVDTGLEQNADRVLAAIQQLQRQLEIRTPAPERFAAEGNPSTVLEPYYRNAPPKPIRYIVNTTMEADHLGGNARLAVAGKTFTGGNVTGQLSDVGEGAAILAHENLLNRLSTAKAATRALPTDTYFGDHFKLSQFFNGEGVVLYHVPAAVTDGDTVVYFRRADVFATGDLLRMSAYPLIDREKGGTIQGILAGLNRLVDMSVAEFRTEGGTMFVGGHGRIGDLADLTYYRDMCTIIRDRVQDMLKNGMTLAQVKAAKPTEDWDPRFGTDPAWTPDMFVEAVYTSLQNPPGKR